MGTLAVLFLSVMAFGLAFGDVEADSVFKLADLVLVTLPEVDDVELAFRFLTTIRSSGAAGAAEVAALVIFSFPPNLTVVFLTELSLGTFLSSFTASMSAPSILHKALTDLISLLDKCRASPLYTRDRNFSMSSVVKSYDIK